MNASDIKDFVFNKSAVGGYKVSDVRGCLKEISEYVSTLEEKTYKLDRENKSLKSELDKVKKTQEEIKEIMVSAHDYKNKIIKEAKNEAEEIVSEARNNGEKIKEKAEQASTQKIEELNKEINEKISQLENLKQEVSKFRTKLFEIYKDHLDLISKLPQVKNENVDSGYNNKIEIKKSEPVVDEEESEIFEKLQSKPKAKLNEDLSDFVGFKKNLSESEHIFQTKLNGDSDQNYSDAIKNTDGYIKSRFDELK